MVKYVHLKLSLIYDVIASFWQSLSAQEKTIKKKKIVDKGHTSIIYKSAHRK